MKYVFTSTTVGKKADGSEHTFEANHEVTEADLHPETFASATAQGWLAAKEEGKPGKPGKPADGTPQ